MWHLLAKLKSFIVFGGGSLLGAIIDYFITLSLHNHYGLSPGVALVLAMVVSSLVVFLYHDHITFRVAEKGALVRYGRFALLTVLVFGLRFVVLNGLMAWGASTEIAVIVAIVAVSIINFGISSAFIFLKDRP
ncbi:GtrA family protein [Rhizobium alvei]|uniref:GtrA family protein n=1 Tax=Rhizobium alvei TaxID=1132659 RepID=A0ABT8YM14_9HYPH|nr:GtrA family protein [Rhizobium alvei]MDO6964388.1 GtrA family protein [Rhizobium alvei]